MTPRAISLLVLTFLIGCLGLAFLKVVQPFLLPLLLAAVTAMLLQPLMRRYRELCRHNEPFAAALTTITLLSVVLIPLLIGIILGATQLYDWSTELFAQQTAGSTYDRVYQKLQVSQLVHNVQPYLDPDGKPEEFEARALAVVRQNLPKLLEKVANQTFGIAASTLGLFGSLVSLAITLAVYIAGVYFFLVDGRQLLDSTQAMIPVQRDHQNRLLDQFVKVTRAVVIGTFAAALTQGLATGIGLYFADINRVVLLTVVATLLAVVPMAGTTLVWVPCAVAMCFTRDNWAFPVIAFSLYNILVVGSLDNIIRSYVLNSDVKLHPLLAFISVLGGLQWIGLWGVFIGPVIASCLYALAAIINEELAQYTRQSGKETVAEAVVSEVAQVVTAAAVEAAANPPESPASAQSDPKASPQPKSVHHSKRRR